VAASYGPASCATPPSRTSTRCSRPSPTSPQGGRDVHRTGHRGQERRRPQAALVISKARVGDYDNNAYLLRCRSTGEQLLVDAAAEPQRLLDLIGPGGVVGVLTTHAHRDHWSALADVLAATGAPHLAGAIDADDIEVPTDVRLADGDTVRFGDVVLDVIHLRGHTPGSITR
jgi:glyoxylase-like metal-dependent hydrolase (beta-lactamase superfamily II)